jgi:hypothetical protein
VPASIMLLFCILQKCTFRKAAYFWRIIYRTKLQGCVLNVNSIASTTRVHTAASINAGSN